MVTIPAVTLNFRLGGNPSDVKSVMSECGSTAVTRWQHFCGVVVM